MSKVLFFTAGAAVMASRILYYRPIPDNTKSPSGPDRKLEKSKLTSKTNPFDEPIADPIAFERRVTSIITLNIFKFLLSCGGNIRIKKDKHYYAFISNVLDRDPDKALITVANHRSMLDDPGLMSNLLPYSISFNKGALRWTLCAQEFCFNKHLPPLAYGMSGAFQVLPIWRGGGVNQKLLLDFARQAACGRWLHIFPEGGVWQHETLALGGRNAVAAVEKKENSEYEKEVDTWIARDRLKWGVGKLIAHAPRTPVVIPFFHSGMEHMLPFYPGTKDLRVSVPVLVGHRVTVCFGPAVSFDDLISAHEAKHGLLKKYSASRSSDERELTRQRGGVGEDMVVGSFHEYWDSRPEDYELYRAIARRLEEALLALAEECRRDVRSLDKEGTWAKPFSYPRNDKSILCDF